MERELELERQREREENEKEKTAQHEATRNQGREGRTQIAVTVERVR